MKKISEKVFNPALMLGIGLFPLLIIADSLKSALLFGVLIFLALFVSSLIYYAFKPIILENVRIPIYALITFSAVYFLDSVVSELFIKQYNSVHALVAYIFVAVILMYMFEINKETERFGKGLKTSIILGVEYLISLVIVGSVRELLSNGSLWGKAIVVDYSGLEFFSTIAGGLLVVIVYAFVYNVISGFIRSRRTTMKNLVDRYEKYLKENVEINNPQEQLEEIKEEE